ncbi:MAG: hypothetical protein K8Q97_03330 [Candidatus Andersenbacteria bacterium]|nr:hypothetical protein [Candidatus Andersenbacteria bacterium]
MSYKGGLYIIVAIIASCVFATHAAHAQSSLAAEQIQIDASSVPQFHRSWWQTLLSYVGLKSNNGAPLPVGTTFHVTSSAYAPSKYQTDANPCVTAAGTIVRPGVVATNFLPLGTILAISGDVQKYIVEDRMNARYKGYYMDIWFPSTSKALEFGRKKLDITIVAYGKPGDPLILPTPTPLVQPASSSKKNIWNSLADSAVLIGKLLMSKTDPNHYDVTCSQ